MSETGFDGYARFPVIRGETMVFVAEDDLWTVATDGGIARRLTADLARVGPPALSHDGELVAFSSTTEGESEVYVMPVVGGPERRLTWLGDATTQVIGFTADGDVLFASAAGQPFGSLSWAYRVPAAGGPVRRLPYGPVRSVAYGPDGAVLIGRNTTDPARWKRYRGGTAGRLWVDRAGDGNFERLLADLDANIASPMWLGGRVYFISDHEGVGNVYSCRPDGSGIRRHTDHEDYYARSASTDGRRIAYQRAGELWLLDPERDRGVPVRMHLGGPRTQRAGHYVTADEALGGVDLHPTGRSIVADVRGKLVQFACWEEAARQHGEPYGVRYRLAEYIGDGERLCAVSDADGEDGIDLFDTAAGGSSRRLAGGEIGRALELAVSPDGTHAAVANHRHELLMVNLTDGAVRTVDRSEVEPIDGLAWSADGRWLAYAFPATRHASSIKVYAPADGTVREVVEPRFANGAPDFDPKGRYLYFISYRTFDPVSDSLQFEASFPKGGRPYLVTLRADVPSPFVPRARPVGSGSPDKSGESDESAKQGGTTTAAEVRIDFDGITDRVLAFPVDEGRYEQVVGLDGKVLLVSSPVEGQLSHLELGDSGPADATIAGYDLTELKYEVLIEQGGPVAVSADRKAMAYRSGDRLRVLPAGKAPSADAGDKPGRASGWVDLQRVRVAIDPGAEWRQMFTEAWRLQRDHFWVPDMSGVDWAAIRDRYAPIADRVATRSDFSDLIWEMQGELGTSHAYEVGGDYRPTPQWQLGNLGADIGRDDSGRWRIEHIARGDSWDSSSASPLASPGLRVAEGDTVLAVNGRAVPSDTGPGPLLVHQAGQTVELTIAGPDGADPRPVLVTTLADDRRLRYREWVEANRRHVHEATRGRVGYLHIPDMTPWGFSEFHRGFLTELHHDALIVDVRFNGGGSVSQLLLEKLARRRIGYDLTRWGGAEPYPAESPAGPLLCLTNEWAGSDGDIFTHGFRLMKLGPVVGMRTWGGVIGIDPSRKLADGTLVTQPEFSFWFPDVGWGVENHGADPDVECEVAPADYAAGRDPQLATGLLMIQEALEEFRADSPDLSTRPVRTPPVLPEMPIAVD